METAINQIHQTLFWGMGQAYLHKILISDFAELN